MMKHTVILEESGLVKHCNHLFASAPTEDQIGLLFGQKSEALEQDFVIGIIPTPKPESDTGCF